jgi:hypothetical protein
VLAVVVDVDLKRVVEELVIMVVDVVVTKVVETAKLAAVVEIELVVFPVVVILLVDKGVELE